MSATTAAWNYGLLRIITQTIRTTAPGANVLCPWCDENIQIDTINDPGTKVACEVWCSGKKRCFQIQQVIFRLT